MTFEHLPPRKAYNSDRANVYGMEEWLARENGATARSTIQQRGMGSWSLCAECNNNTGAWYASEYVRAARAGAYVLRNIPLNAADESLEKCYVSLAFRGDGRRRPPYPLRFVKQAIAMVLACNGAGFAAKNPELGDFVLNRERLGLSSRYQLYLALYAGSYARTLGLSAAITHGRMTLSTEVAAPPFAVVMTIDSPPGAIETANITPLCDVPYGATSDIEMEILVGFGHTPFPMDFRSKAMVARDRALNERAA